ncbi:hypothetical protein [Roseivirga seohaensis]|nr:hypothetical protein [Roseivirga seohaensis]
MLLINVLYAMISLSRIRFCIASLLFLCVFCYAKAQEQNIDFFPSELSKALITQPTEGNPRSYTIQTQEYADKATHISLSEIIQEYLLENNRIYQVNLNARKTTLASYTFDSLFRIKAIRYFTDDAPTPWIFYQYNDIENTKTELRLRRDSTVYTKTVLTFNENDLLISRKEFFGESDLKSEQRFVYNDYGDVETEVSLGNQNQSTYVYEYQYSSEGNKLMRKKFNNEKLESRVEYQYFPDSSVQISTEYGFNKRPKSQNLTVLQDSLRVEITGYFSSIDTTEYRSSFKELYVGEDLLEYESRTINGVFVNRFKTFYEYDSHGNWIKRMTYENNKLIKVENRLFRY